MKKIFFVCLSLLTCAVGFTQGGSAPVLFTTPNNATFVDDIITENNKFGRVIYADKRNESAVRSIYLFEEDKGFINIYTKDGKGFKVIDANFDLVKQQLEVKMEDGKYFTFDTSTIEYFVKNNKKYIFVDNVARPLHEELLKTENFSLLKGFTIIKMEAMTNPLTNEVTKPAFYSKDEVYFLKSGDNFIEIPQKTSKFLRLFENKSGEMKAFINSNDLSNDEDADLIKIFNHYNSI